MKNSLLLLTAILAASFVTVAEDRPAITGVAYVRVAAKNPQASQRFYRETLGYPSTKCGEGCAGYRISETQHIEVVTAKETDGLILVAFRTSDAEELRAYLAAKKLSVPAALHKNPDGSRQFEMADPEGHRIAFVQSPKSALMAFGNPVSQRMIHAGFVVRDRAAMDRFYKDILGFRLYWHGGMTDNVTDWVDMQVPDGTDWLEYMLNVGPQADHRTLGVVNHFALGTDSIHKASKDLQKTGWKESPQEKPQLGRDGKWQLNLYDPDETRVELMEFVPVEKPCCSEYVGLHPGE